MELVKDLSLLVFEISELVTPSEPNLGVQDAVSTKYPESLVYT